MNKKLMTYVIADESEKDRISMFEYDFTLCGRYAIIFPLEYCPFRSGTILGDLVSMYPERYFIIRAYEGVFD